jgi:Fe-S cluster assembly protein SufD
MKTIKLTAPGNYTYILDKQNQEIAIIGRFKVEKSDKFSLNLAVIHRAKNTSANISLKATAGDTAHVNIRGKVLVEAEATGTNSFLEERILLLSPKATAEAVPDLEIKTNDVICSHAATVGEIDAKQIFYLSSRGLPENEAKNLIAEGFLK